MVFPTQTQTQTQPAGPVDAGALMTRVSQLIEFGRPGAARPLFAAVRGLMPPSVEISILAARLALSDGAMEDIEAELDAAVAANPEHPGLRKARAELRRRAGDLEGATRDAAEAVILDRTDSAAKALLGALLHEIGRSTDAAACLSEALAAVPADASWREALSQALAATGESDRAMAVLLEGVALTPAATGLRNAAILLAIRRRDFSTAELLAEQGRRAGAADAITFGLKGHALSSLGRHGDAAASYEEALKLAPGDTYVRHLAAAAGIAATAPRAPDDYVRTLFDGYAERFEAHLISLGYRIPGLIRRQAIEFAKLGAIGPVLDLGCGTGLASLALADIPEAGPFTGIDLSPLMLEQARAKALYESLREAPLPAALADLDGMWRLIVAADLLCYFGALEDMFAAVRSRLTPGGRFVFSLEELIADRDGAVPGNGDWALGRMGRYAHAAPYVVRCAEAAGFRRLTLDREALRHEAGGPVAGLLIVLERPGEDA